MQDNLAILGYGPAPGLELVPYFLGLLAWAGLALAAVLLSPIRALIRRMRGKGGVAQVSRREASETEPAADGPNDGSAQPS